MFLERYMKELGVPGISSAFIFFEKMRVCLGLRSGDEDTSLIRISIHNSFAIMCQAAIIKIKPEFFFLELAVEYATNGHGVCAMVGEVTSLVGESCLNEFVNIVSAHK
jgi:hypothetical protein